MSAVDELIAPGQNDPALDADRHVLLGILNLAAVLAQLAAVPFLWILLRWQTWTGAWGGSSDPNNVPVPTILLLAVLVCACLGSVGLGTGAAWLSFRSGTGSVRIGRARRVLVGNTILSIVTVLSFAAFVLANW